MQLAGARDLRCCQPGFRHEKLDKWEVSVRKCKAARNSRLRALWHARIPGPALPWHVLQAPATTSQDRTGVPKDSHSYEGWT